MAAKKPTWSWRKAIVQVFGADPRSLALFRIGVGAMILWDVAVRWWDAEAFLSDNGPVDREMGAALLQMDYGQVADLVWSLNYLSGELWYQQLLLILLGAAAVGLIVGWKTWWMTLACWVLVVSMHMRCPVILSSGDTLLRCVLFWSLFTPLGMCWSWDAKRRLGENGSHNADGDELSLICNAGTAGLFCQLIFMYWFAGLAKWNIHWWEGDAMEYVLRHDLYARPWAQTLLAYPLMLKLVSWGTLFAEIFLVLLLFVPWQNAWWRWVNIVVYYLLHLSIAATMEIGLFPYISMVGWLPLLPSAIYGGWSGSRDPRWLEYSQDDVDYGTPIMEKSQPTGRDWRGGWWMLGQSFAVGMIGYVALWNVANIPNTYDGDLAERLEQTPAEFAAYTSARQPFALAMPNGLRWLGPVTGTGQHFQMFGVPPLHTPWFVYDATLEDGVRIDLVRLETVNYQRPSSILSSIPGHHWRKLHDNLLGYRIKDLQERVAQYRQRLWDQSHREGKKIAAYKVTCFAEWTGPQYQGQDPLVEVWYDWQRPIETVDDLERLLESHPSLLPGL